MVYVKRMTNPVYLGGSREKAKRSIQLTEIHLLAHRAELSALEGDQALWLAIVLGNRDVAGYTETRIPGCEIKRAT